MPSKRKTLANRLLAPLPVGDQQRLVGELETVSFAFGDVLYEVGDNVNFVYFPETMLASMGMVVDAKHPFEIAMVGADGLVGASFAMGMEVASVQASVRIAGAAKRMPIERFRHEFEHSTVFRKAVLRAGHALMLQIAQTSGCNRFHVVESRLARWLLMARDRLGVSQFQLTHDDLSKTLGVRRVGVTNAAQGLKLRKMIGYSRGTISIMNGPALEAAACSCYKKLKSCSTAEAI
jgi:CRP-like cAMP-binding protein